MSTGLTLICPVRGRLKAKARGADGLTPTEEKLRVDAIRHLISVGYPKENIWVEAVIKRFGSGGRNSFRADLAVLDRPVKELTGEPDEILMHAVVVGEVKRDNADAEAALSLQVVPMLDFATRTDCLALYWDDVEQRVYWYDHSGKVKVRHEGPLASLPGFGNAPSVTRLTISTIDADKPLLGVFKRIEDILHAASIGPQRRFGIMLQLLLAKLHDEHQNAAKPDAPLVIQDFRALGTDAAAAKSAVNHLLGKAVAYYQNFLPEPVPKTLTLSADVILDVCQILAPIKITSMEQRVIQDFYMYFGKHIYKWDLAQYFTPTNVTEFIVAILNPQQFEHVMDPACGSADFLTAAFRRGAARGWHDYASSVHGSDVSPEAVQVAVLNMILNGDGKTNIACEDSLVKIPANTETMNVVICNPPFGSRILERKAEALGNFDLGREWVADADGVLQPTGQRLSTQQSGILFAEACARLIQSSPQGRFALVVPNGYLGNRSGPYRNLREWLLRHCRIVVIAALPRFTFKSSGADVSASVIFCEKRETPLMAAKDSEDYPICIEVVDRVGYNLKAKTAEPLYARDPKDGTYLVDTNGEMILESDFAGALNRIRSSETAEACQWLTSGVEDEIDDTDDGWSISSKDVTDDPLLTLDPKRHCEKYRSVRNEIAEGEHFRLGDVVEFIPEGQSRSGETVELDPEETYHYIEISDVGAGTYRFDDVLGWALPSRARHFAESGDIYLGAIWSSVTKWCMIGEECADTYVTNGLRRVRVKAGMEDHLLDVVIGLCSEAYATQMRGIARGSDGLAEIGDDDMAEVILPRVTDPAIRAEIEPYIEQLRTGATSLESKVSTLISTGALAIPVPPARFEHTSIV
ncbi:MULTISPECIES: class I SAM-dependent DNA methyltransferase [unclassified Mycobacterium]|uniref:HsdM family class I SAM-dependent methyltransferase n=1 Tax=unclassified Mycobacterium TaxID=2642494 RepID=UPI0029C7FB9A|nr:MULTISPECIES: N-6 DNA methylase [unclassified Mycobacterium]